MRILFISAVYLLGFSLFLSLAVFFLSLEPSEFLKLLIDFEVLSALKLSVWTSLLSTLLVLVLAVPAAYALARYEFPLKRFAKVLIDLPMAFPELLVGFLLLVLFSNLLTPLLEKLNFEVVFTPKAVLLAEIAVSLPFAVKVLYTAFTSVDLRLEVVARSLGYAPLEVFFKVSLPAARRGLAAAVAVTFARSFGAFGAVLVFAGGVRLKTETLPVGIFLNISYGELEKAIAMGLVLIAVSLGVLLLLEYLKVEG